MKLKAYKTTEGLQALIDQQQGHTILAERDGATWLVKCGTPLHQLESTLHSQQNGTTSASELAEITYDLSRVGDESSTFSVALEAGVRFYRLEAGASKPPKAPKAPKLGKPAKGYVPADTLDAQELFGDWIAEPIEAAEKPLVA